MANHQNLFASNGNIDVEVALVICGFAPTAVKTARYSLGLKAQETVAVVSEKLQALLDKGVGSLCIRNSTRAFLTKLGTVTPADRDANPKSLRQGPSDFLLRQQLAALLGRTLDEIARIRFTPDGLPSLIDVVRAITGLSRPRTSQVLAALVKLNKSFSVRNFKFPGPGQRATPVPSNESSLTRIIFQLLRLQADKRDAVARLFLDHTGCDGDLADQLICDAKNVQAQDVAAAEIYNVTQHDSPESPPKTDQVFETEAAFLGTQAITHLARENVADLYLGIIGPERRKTSDPELANAVVFKIGKTHDIATRQAQLVRYFSKENCVFDLILVWKGCGDLEKPLQNHLACHRFYGFKGQREIFCASGLCTTQIVKTTVTSVELLRAQDDSDRPQVKRRRSSATDLLQIKKEQAAQETQRAHQAEAAEKIKQAEAAEKTKQVEAAEKTKQVEAAEKTKQVEAAEKTKQVEAVEKTKQVEAAQKTKRSELQNERLKLLAETGATVEQLLSLLAPSTAGD